MNKQTIITILLALVAVAGQGQVRCHVIGTVDEGTIPVELRIYRDGEDPKNSTLRPVLKNGRFECDVMDEQIERWHIVDFGEVMEKGMTLRSGEFLWRTARPLPSGLTATSSTFNPQVRNIRRGMLWSKPPK